MRFWHVLLLCSALAAICFTGCSSQEEAVAFLPQSQPDIPDEVSDSVHIRQMNLNKLDFDLWALRVNRWEAKHLTIAQQVKIQSYNPDGSLKSTLVADSARVDEINNFIIGKGHVRVDSENGIMKAPYAKWDRNSDELFAQGNVVVIRGENTLYGSELKTDIRLDRIEILEVSAQGTINEEDFTW
jgi:LPS export ABC transporter protein LptC